MGLIRTGIGLEKGKIDDQLKGCTRPGDKSSDACLG